MLTHHTSLIQILSNSGKLHLSVIWNLQLHNYNNKHFSDSEVSITTLKLIFGLFNSTCIVEISMETFIENIFNFGVSNNEEIQEELSFILNPGRTR